MKGASEELLLVFADVVVAGVWLARVVVEHSEDMIARRAKTLYCILSRDIELCRAFIFGALDASMRFTSEMHDIL